VERLLKPLKGQTIITADHDELSNDRITPNQLRRYEYRGGVYTDELVKTPSFVVDFEGWKESVNAGESSWE